MPFCNARKGGCCGLCVLFTSDISYKAVPMQFPPRKYCATRLPAVRIMFIVLVVIACLVSGGVIWFYETLPSPRVSNVTMCRPVSSKGSFIAVFSDILATRVDGCLENENPRLQRFLTWDGPNGRIGNNIKQFELALTLALFLKRGLVLHPLLYNGESFGAAFDVNAAARLLGPYGGIIHTQNLLSGNWRYDWLYPPKVQSFVDVDWADVCNYYPSHPLLVLDGHDLFYLNKWMTTVPGAMCTEVAGKLQSVCTHNCSNSGIDAVMAQRPTLMPHPSVIQNAQQTLKLLRGWSRNGTVCTAHIRRYDCEGGRKCESRCGKVWVEHLNEQIKAHGCALWFIFSDRPNLIPLYTRGLPPSTFVVKETDIFPSHFSSETFVIATLIAIAGMSDMHISVPNQSWERTIRAVRAKYRQNTKSPSSHLIIKFPSELKTCICKGVC